MFPFPDFPYSIREIRSYCESATRMARTFNLNEYHIMVHRLNADDVGEGITSGFHNHSVYEGIILLKGSAEYITETAQTLRPANVLLMEPYAKHSWRVVEGPCLRLMCEFSIDPPLLVPTPQTWPCWPEILWDVALLLGDIAGTAPNRHILVSARLSAIISRLLTLAEWPNCPLPEVEAPLKFVDIVDSFLTDNLARPLTIADVAYHVGMSERSLIRHFRQLTGETVVQRLFQLRMNKAAGLLADTNIPVSEICTEVGINDPAYFCSRFRQYFAMTPLHYRKQATETPSH